MKKIYLLGVLLFGGVLNAHAAPCSDSYSTISVNQCESYTSPSGKTFISSGTFMDTISNMGGCDSIITIHLTLPGDFVVSDYAGVDYDHKDGSAATAWFRSPQATAVDAAGNVYVCEAQTHRIRKISASGIVTTIAGDGQSGFADGVGTLARFSNPSDIVIDGSVIYM